MKKPLNNVRVRIAPSPTGGLHVGTARTALYNWLFAKKYNGKFILRIEDTDRTRSTEKNEHNIIAGLKWLGLDWDEGPEIGGDFGPYRQTERLSNYKKYIKKLLESGQAYYCYCSAEELAEEKAMLLKAGKPPIYQRKCCYLKPEELTRFETSERKPVIRFKVPDEDKIEYTDLVRGKLRFNSKDFGDFVIAKSDGEPLFLLANVIDDYEMKISHVIRGEDHIPNVPKQLLIAKALHIDPPEFAHLSLILNPDRSKMSKRAGPTHVAEYQKMGYLPHALLNFIALLGWNPGTTQEIFTPDELVSQFTLENINKAGAVFDLKRLQWMNGMYLRKLSPDQLAELAEDYWPNEVKQKDKNKLKKILVTVQDRIQYLAEISELTDFYFELNDKYEPELLIWKKSDLQTTQDTLHHLLEILDTDLFSETATPDEIEQKLRNFAASKKLGIGELFWPLRVALSGLKASPGPQEIIWVLGLEEAKKRLNLALDKLKSHS